MQETPKSQQTESVNKGEINVTEHEPKPVAKEKEPRIESIVQFETGKERQDVTATVKTIRFEVEVSSSESPEGETLTEVKDEITEILKTTGESVKDVKHPGAEENAQVLKKEIQETLKSQETESVNKGEINLTEHEHKTVPTEKGSIVQFETVKESKDVTTTGKKIRFEVEVSSTESQEGETLPEVKDEIPEILTTTEESPKDVKDPGAEEKKAQMLKQEIQETPKSQQTESVKKGEINVTEHESKPVSKEKEPRIESIVQFETVKERQDVTTTVKPIRFEVEVSSTESPEGEKLPEIKQDIPEIPKITEESPKDVKDPSVEEKKVQVVKQEMQESPKSQETESVKKGEINVPEHEHKTVPTEKGSIVQFETGKESKDVTTKVKTIRFEVEVSSTESPECEKLPEIKQDEIPEIPKITEESPKDVKDPSVEEKKVQVVKQEMQESPKSQETESVKKGEINVTEHEAKPVTKEEEPRIESIVQFETVKERQDVTTTVKPIRFEVEVSSTESPECEKLPEIKQDIPEIPKITEESPKDVKDPGAEEKKVQVVKQEMQESPKSQETESVNKGEINVTEHESKPVSKDKEPRIESIVQFDTIKERQSVTTTVKTIRFEVEVSSTESPEGETLPEVKDEIPEILKTTEESPKDVKDPGAEEKKAQMLKQEIQETPKSQQTESVKKGEISVTEHESKPVSKEKEPRIESIVQFETVKERQDVTTTVKPIRFEVEVSSTESPECEKLPEIKQDIPEIPKISEESPKDVKDPSVEEKKVQVVKQEMQESPKSQETESVKKGEINVPEHEHKTVPTEKGSIVQFETVKESKDVTTTVKTIRFEVEVSSTESPECEQFPEVKDKIPEILKTTEESPKDVKDPGSEEKKVHVVKQEMQESPKSQETESVKKGEINVTEHEAKPVTKEEEPRIESIVQFETVKERQDVTTTVKTIRFEVEVSSTESPVGETLPEVKDEIPEILTTTEESPKDVKDPGAEEKKAQMLKQEIQETPKSQQTESVKKGEINVTEHESKPVSKEKEPRIESIVQFETVKERQDVTTTVKPIRFEVEVSSTESPEGEKLPEIKQDIPEIPKITEESPKDVKDPSVEEKKVQVVKQEMQESPKSQETESVKKGEINVPEHEHKTVPTEKGSIVQFETVKESKDVTTTGKKIRFEVEVSSTESQEGETLPEVKDEIPEILTTTEESPKDVKDPGSEEKKVHVVKQEMQESPKSQETESVKKGEISVTEHESKPVSKEKEPRIESIVQFETVKERQDVTTTVKPIRFEVEVSSTESPECEKLPEVKQDIPEIPKITEERLKEVKDPGVEEMKVQVLKQEMQESPKSQETESVNKGEINVTEHEPKTVSKEKEPRIESIVQFETVKERQDVTTTVKTIRFEVEVSSTESPEGEKLPEDKDEIPEILKTTEESPKDVKDPGAEEKKVQVLKQEMQESPKSQETEPVNKGETNVTEHEPKTVSKEKEPNVQSETVKESKDVMTTVKTIEFEVEVSSTELPSGLSLDPKVQIDKYTTDPTKKKEEEQKEKR
ncbi:unnamed protein product [Pleuronectes platessa]|uniref:Uncharacterized protein n=1 Tax=Pleuronectes platessa TaxID=8262 RepID=A0A9N7VNW6_PLEPL|nr:unnamed protein product [Pleuronectes platessa]